MLIQNETAFKKSARVISSGENRKRKAGRFKRSGSIKKPLRTINKSASINGDMVGRGFKMPSLPSFVPPIFKPIVKASPVVKTALSSAAIAPMIAVRAVNNIKNDGLNAGMTKTIAQTKADAKIIAANPLVQAGAKAAMSAAAAYVGAPPSAGATAFDMANATMQDYNVQLPDGVPLDMIVQSAAPTAYKQSSAPVSDYGNVVRSSVVDKVAADVVKTKSDIDKAAAEQAAQTEKGSIPPSNNNNTKNNTMLLVGGGILAAVLLFKKR